VWSKAAIYRKLKVLNAGAYDSAVNDYTQVIALEPRGTDAVFQRGSVFEKLGKLEDAVDDFSAVIALDPSHAKALYARGACLNLMGDFARAVGKFLYNIPCLVAFLATLKVP
jgi:tetratricopeptide (TPR) repeat protein